MSTTTTAVQHTETQANAPETAAAAANDATMAARPEMKAPEAKDAAVQAAVMPPEEKKLPTVTTHAVTATSGTPIVSAIDETEALKKIEAALVPQAAKLMAEAGIKLEGHALTIGRTNAKTHACTGANCTHHTPTTDAVTSAPAAEAPKALEAPAAPEAAAAPLVDQPVEAKPEITTVAPDVTQVVPAAIVDAPASHQGQVAANMPTIAKMA